jgi:RNA polymerase sigma factor (sigma-70 family)
MDFASTSVLTRVRLSERLNELWELTGDDNLRLLSQGQTPQGLPETASADARFDLISTSLMKCFKNTEEPRVFAVLFELNQQAFLHAVHSQLRRAHVQVDAGDVVQEVFLNIYRYPHRFLAERADSFRNWGHRIVRNTLLKFLKGAGRAAACLSLDDEVLQAEDMTTLSPVRTAEYAEAARLADTAYILYLQLYLAQFQRLTPKEQRALTMVEVEGRSYRDAAAELGIRLENLKMVIFRGRRRILRGMADCLGLCAAGAADLPVAREIGSGVVRHPPQNGRARAALEAPMNISAGGPFWSASAPTPTPLGCGRRLRCAPGPAAPAGHVQKEAQNEGT